MVDPKTSCKNCGCTIRQVTADRRDGMCVPCYRQHSKPSEEVFAERVFERIDAAVEPFTTYRSALKSLDQLPPGYAMCFAFHYVHEDILNGGLSQLYRNSTWALVLQAEAAAHAAGFSKLSNLLREVVYYYHRQGRSKHKRSLTEEFFAQIPADWDKTLQQLEDDFYAIESDANSVILSLCRDSGDLFTDDQ